ncbi:GNAT family N-acetyltransferase [Halorussus lipolyticus]|uniref:GNAT family N-acetyltransferase n=1 Tax=Halorussus lipolyticus TaxID=3034024 RepID=UPI0023E76C01|nr:GNAT family N-acetyltransferase [Halorussus sp. DT80]
MSIEIRRGRPADIDALQRVSRRAWKEAHAPIIGEETVEDFLGDHYDAESFRAEIEDDETVFAVAVDDAGVPVGFVSARPSDDDPAVYDLGRLYVSPERWGEGIGQQLLARAEETIADWGGERVLLGVMAENDRAVSFYESAGYDRTGEFYDERIGTQGYTYVAQVSDER